MADATEATVSKASRVSRQKAAPAQKVLVSELKSLIDGADRGYFIPAGSDGYKTEMLQGDGWRGFQIFSFKSGNVNAARGIVLSNSCDVSAENARVLPPKLTFAPIVNNLARSTGPGRPMRMAWLTPRARTRRTPPPSRRPPSTRAS